MRLFLTLSFVLFCIWTTGACSTAATHPRRGGDSVKGGQIETREQLLSAVNLWMRNHNQPELISDELLGRVIDEGFAATVLWKEIEPPVESLIVCFKRNRRFKYPIKLQTDWTDGIELTFSGERLRLPPHHTLSLHILATYSDIWPSNENPRKQIDLSMPLGTALAGKQAEGKPPSERHSEFQGTVKTPKQLLSAINAWRRRAHKPELTLDEITARSADEMLFRHDLAEKLDPIAESFLKCLAENRRFEFPIRLTTYGLDESDVFSRKERLRSSPHDAFAVEIANHPLTNEGEKHYQIYINWTRIILSYVFPTEEVRAGKRPSL